jgi:succinate-semialdehyde dehydrogenase/glutarate-semialdehyde dehydrogenase
MRSVNPATAELIRDYPEHAEGEVEGRLQRAASAFAAWKKTAPAERGGRMGAAAHVLREGRSRYARLMTEEMGKPIAESEAEIDKCAWNCEFYAEHAESFLRNEDGGQALPGVGSPPGTAPRRSGAEAGRGKR